MNTLEQYRAAAELIYPGLGAWTYDRFDEYNRLYFDNVIPVIPVQWHLTLPHGRSIALACAGSLIQMGIYCNSELNLKDGKPCLYGSHVILHEMVHIYLQIRGEDPRHNSKPWCREIMRISKMMGFEINAEPERVVKERLEDGTRKSVRKSYGIARSLIASWPHFAFSYSTGQLLPDYIQ